MKHILFGGNGSVGRHLAARLVREGQDVIVCDVAKDSLPHHANCRFMKLDVTDKAQFMQLDIQPEDVVYNLSARTLSPLMVRSKRRDFYWPVNYHGTVNIIEKMAACDATRLVHFTTDLIYGHTVTFPMTEDHPAKPLGEYGLSKWKTEELAADWREKGMNIAIFRPSMIVGPGRFGLLTMLFRLVDSNLPVPMIGSGRNPFQFVSVFDCAEAARLAWKTGVPNGAYNLGSDNPPPVRKLLGNLIRHAGSKSILVPTPAWAVKRTLDLLDLINIPMMDPEQYRIADEMGVLDCSKAKQQLGWSADDRDEDMLLSAFDQYRAGRPLSRRKTAVASDPTATT